MENIDRKRIDAIILRESGNSLYMQQQKRRDAKVDERIKAARRKLKEAAPPMNTIALDQELQNLCSQRPKRSVCVVVDMDMFFMACEILKRPGLRDVPACVGHSLISTSNYLARKYGVRSAMAGYIGDALVKELSDGKEELVHVSSNFDLYKTKSTEVKQVLREYDPKLKTYSLDEAFLNLGPYITLKLQNPNWSHDQIRDALLSSVSSSEGESAKHGGFYDSSVLTNHSKEDSSLVFLQSFSPIECMAAADSVLREMRNAVFRQTGGLTCSAGLAPNFMLAKIASDRNKPNGQCLVAADEDSVLNFLRPLPLRKVGGVGRVTEKMCSAFQIRTMQQLYDQRHIIHTIFTPSIASFLLRASVGCSSAFFSEEDKTKKSSAPQKGISRERTFAPNHDWHQLRCKLDEIGHKLSEDMKRKDLWAQNLTVKVKLHNYDVMSKAHTLPRNVFVQSGEEILKYASELFSELRDEFRGQHFSLRLIGIRCSSFRDKDVEDVNQGSLDAFLVEKVEDTKNELTSVSGDSALAAASDSDRDETGPRSAESKVDRFSSVRDKDVEDANQGSLDAFLMEKVVDAKDSISTLGDSAPTTSSERVEDEPGSDEPKADEAMAHETRQIRCPICQKSFCQNQNMALNEHLDNCLSSQAVRTAVKEESAHASVTQKKGAISQFLVVNMN